MNKKLSMAVAGAVMAFGASAANAGITIPAGDWTIDIGGNVNTYYTHTTGDFEVDGDNISNIQTGLLPSAVGIGGKTRQNDLDIAFQFTFFVGADDGAGGRAGGNNSLNIRQAFGSFGDASWGTIKFGRDLGIYGSDAILSDMTLLGVGVGAGSLSSSGGSSTLGRIGSGYIYADWVGQISYASPNWNGFSFAVGLRDPWRNTDASTGLPTIGANKSLGFEGKVTYDWSGDVSGRVWMGYINQKIENSTLNDYTAHSWEIGGKAAYGGFGLVAYYYNGDSIDSNAALLGVGGLPFLTVNNAETDDNGGYIQGTYTIPGVGTKLGLSWGTSNSDQDGLGGNDVENRSWVAGVYHPLTKSLNLVAEYTDNEISVNNNINDIDSNTISLGAIMFF
jgi:predicted porin